MSGGIGSSSGSSHDISSYYPVNLSVKVEGMVLPTWIGACLISVVVIAVVTLLFGIFVLRDIEREIRILQVHVQDVESVLKEHHLATTSDFAEWETGTPRHIRDTPGTQDTHNPPDTHNSHER